MIDALRKKVLPKTVEWLKANTEYINVAKEHINKYFEKNIHVHALSANQISVDLPMIAIRVKDKEVKYFINPSIYKKVGRVREMMFNHINFPNMLCYCEVYSKIKVKYLDDKYKEASVSFSLSDAAVIHALINQLDGIIIFDNAIINIDYDPMYRKIYRIKSDVYKWNYYIEDDNKLFFGGIDIGNIGNAGEKKCVGIILINKKTDKNEISRIISA